MGKRSVSVLALMSALLTAPGLASANLMSELPGTPGQGKTFTLDLFEDQEQSFAAFFPAVSLGTVVLLDGGDPADPADQRNPNLWSDILFFLPSAIPSVELFSAPLPPELVADLLSCIEGSSPGCFSSFRETSFRTVVFILEDQTDVTVYRAGGATYRIHSGPCCERVPEPASLVLLGSGLVGLGGMAWRKARNR